MTDKDKEFLHATVKDLVELHWLMTQTFLRLQRYLEEND